MLKDVIDENVKLLICGTAAGKKSAAVGAYYAGPGNKFWRILHETGLTPRQLEPAEFGKLPEFGIGLTDVVKGQAGNDDEIDFQVSSPEALEAKLTKFRPAVLCFNGKKAAEVFLGRKIAAYGFQDGDHEWTHVFVAPSTSGAANGFWDAAHWHALAARVKEMDNRYPATIEEAVDYLVADLPPGAKRQVVEAESVIDLHFGLGMWIRNVLHLRDGAPVVEGEDGFIEHPDEVSGRILEGLRERLITMT